MDEQLLALLERALEAGSLASIGAVGVTWIFHWVRKRGAEVFAQLDRIEDGIAAMSRAEDEGL